MVVQGARGQKDQGYKCEKSKRSPRAWTALSRSLSGKENWVRFENIHAWKEDIRKLRKKRKYRRKGTHEEERSLHICSFLIFFFLPSQIQDLQIQKDELFFLALTSIRSVLRPSWESVFCPVLYLFSVCFLKLNNNICKETLREKSIWNDITCLGIILHAQTEIALFDSFSY